MLGPGTGFGVSLLTGDAAWDFLLKRSNLHPRFPMSVRQAMSFCHSSVVVRNTRRSATRSQCAGYGLLPVIEWRQVGP